MPHYPDITSEAVRREVSRLLDLPKFQKAPRISEFLSFIVNEELDGRGARLNGTQIAIEVYERDASFDPKIDPIVRVEAQRLRRILDDTFLKEPYVQRCRITVPKGAYRPVFLDSSEDNNKDPESVPSPVYSAPIIEIQDNVLAVLPYRDLSESESESYFAEGFVGSLITALTRFDILQVIAQQSSAKYKDHSVDIRLVGKELGARFILQGSVQRDENKIRVTASLSDALDGTQLWAEQYDRKHSGSDMFQLEDDLTRAVISRVGDAFGAIPHVLSRESREKAAENLTTYEAILRFVAYMAGSRKQDFEPAKEAITKAVEREPDFAPCWAFLSILHSIDYRRLISDQKNLPDLAWECANRATTLAPDFASSRLARCIAAFNTRDADMVIKEADMTIALNPNAVGNIGIVANLIGHAGELTRGIEILSELHRLNPYFPSWFLALNCLNHYMNNEYDAALELAKNFTQDEWGGKYMYLAAIQAQLTQEKEAHKSLQKLLQIEPGFKQDPENYISRRYLKQEFTDKMLQGLRLAGL